MKILSGKVNIDPTMRCQMGCGPHRNLLRETDIIEANYLILFEDTIFLIVSFDLLYIGEKLTELLKNRLGHIFQKDNIFLVASHTHYAPMTDTNKTLFGEANINYIEETVERIVQSITLKLKENYLEVTTNHIQYETNQTCNRRMYRLFGLKKKRIVLNSILLGPSGKNSKTSIKSKIHGSLMLLKDVDGNVAAVIWHFPCHPTSLPYTDRFSSHFIGEIRQHFRSIYHHSVPFIFLQGFSGELRPPSHVAKPKNIYEFLRKIIFGSYFKDFDNDGYFLWVKNIKDELDKALSAMKSPLVHKKNKVSLHRFEIPIREFGETNHQSEGSVNFIKLSLGQIILIGVTAELVYDYQLYLNQLSMEEILIGVGCVEDVFGYIPTRKMQNEGGYESKDYLPSFGIKNLNSDIEIKTKSYLEKIVDL